MRAVFLLALLIMVTSMADPTQVRGETPRPGHVFFRCLLVVNPHEGKTIRDAVIEVDGGKILDVGGAAEVAIPPAPRSWISQTDS
jgi:hypothetical protein